MRGLTLRKELSNIAWMYVGFRASYEKRLSWLWFVAVRVTCVFLLLYFGFSLIGLRTYNTDIAISTAARCILFSGLNDAQEIVQEAVLSTENPMALLELALIIGRQYMVLWTSALLSFMWGSARVARWRYQHLRTYTPKYRLTCNYDLRQQIHGDDGWEVGD